jgi:hypothetical protein
VGHELHAARNGCRSAGHERSEWADRNDGADRGAGVALAFLPMFALNTKPAHAKH